MRIFQFYFVLVLREWRLQLLFVFFIVRYVIISIYHNIQAFLDDKIKIK